MEYILKYYMCIDERTGFCKMSKKKKGRLKIKNIILTVLALIIIIWLFCLACNKTVPKDESFTANKSVQGGSLPADEENQITTTVTTSITTTVTTTTAVKYPSVSQNAVVFPENITSPYAVLINNNSDEIIAYRDYDKKMYPASLTKIMTLIVAVENTENFSDTQLITPEMVDPMIEQDATRAGFVPGETPTIKDLLYGLILPSGADASIALAQYVAGSEEEFVKLMNEKCSELGLKSTHFTNCIGLHNPEHYSTVQDIAIILQYAMENEICREILTTYEYNIQPTEYNPEGLTLYSTMFQRMSGDEMPGVSILGGKTGFTDEAGQCLASFAEINGQEYIMVAANNPSKWYVVYDTLSAYSIYAYGGEAYIPPQ